MSSWMQEVHPSKLLVDQFGVGFCVEQFYRFGDVV